MSVALWEKEERELGLNEMSLVSVLESRLFKKQKSWLPKKKTK
jgi:hypothetical protein